MSKKNRQKNKYKEYEIRRDKIIKEMKDKTEETETSEEKESEETTEVWDSGWAPSKLRVIVDSKLLSACKYIQSKIDGKEFSVLAKGKFVNEGFYVTSEYYIPEQEVETASVDYLENIALKRAEGFNTVIHSHPFTDDTTFSSADAEHINSHFICSVLLNKSSKPVDSIINIPVEGRYLQFEVKDILEAKQVVKVDDAELAKIKIHVYVPKVVDYTSSKQTSIDSHNYLEDDEEKWERAYQRSKGKMGYNAYGWDGSDY